MNPELAEERRADEQEARERMREQEEADALEREEAELAVRRWLANEASMEEEPTDEE